MGSILMDVAANMFCLLREHWLVPKPERDLQFPEVHGLRSLRCAEYLAWHDTPSGSPNLLGPNPAGHVRLSVATSVEVLDETLHRFKEGWSSSMSCIAMMRRRKFEFDCLLCVDRSCRWAAWAAGCEDENALSSEYLHRRTYAIIVCCQNHFNR